MQRCFEIIWAYDRLVMPGINACRHEPGETALIESRIIESDREGLDGQARLLRHQGHHGCRVQTTAEERAERYVAAHADAHGIPEQMCEFLLHGQRVAAHVAFGNRGQVPVPVDFGALPVRDQVVARWELANPAEKG